MSDETWDDAPCTDCGDTGITYQTERVCSCLAGLAIEMIDADACPSPTDRISSIEAQLLAAERDRDALREALAMLANIAEQYVLEVDGAQKRGASWYTQGASGLYQQVMLWSGRMRATIDRARAALTANHSAPVVEE